MLLAKSAVKPRGIREIGSMTAPRSLSTLTNLGHALDHPEAVAWGPDGKVYAGGEAGQLYRMGLNDSICEEIAKVEGGFLLGLAHDADGNTYPWQTRFLETIYRVGVRFRF